MNKLKVASVSAVVITSAALATHVSAGAKTGLTVLISMSPVISAQGSLGSARASADTVQLIGCTVETSLSSGTTGTCSAVNAAGTFVSCTSTDPEMIATMASISGGNSFLRFTTNTNGGECTTVKVINSSQFLPLTP